MNTVLQQYLKSKQQPTDVELLAKEVARAIKYAEILGHYEFIFQGAWYPVKKTETKAE